MGTWTRCGEYRPRPACARSSHAPTRAPSLVPCARSFARYLIDEYGLDPNGTDPDTGGVPLHTASCGGQIRAVRLLVEEYRVDVRRRCGGGEDARDKAVRLRKRDVVELLDTYLGSR